MESLKLKLPSGLVVQLRELNGLDSVVAARAAAKYEDESLRPQILALAEAGQTVERLGEKHGPFDFSELLKLSNKDQQALLLVHSDRNTLSVAELASLKAQMGPGSTARAAILDCVMLARLETMPFAEAMKLPVKERQALLNTLAEALGLGEEEE